MSILKTNFINRFSLFAFLSISITFIGVKIHQVRSEEPFIRESYALSWDNYGYYLHLPAFVIHHDIGIEDHSWLDTLNNKYQKDRPFYQAWPGQKNRLVNVYPVGYAVFNLPFFIVGHISAKIFGYDADGLSPPYQWAMMFAGLFYGIAGFWLLRKLLLRYFNDKMTTLLMLLIALATNLFYYATYICTLPHITLFAADILILLFTIKWHEQQKINYAIALGFLIGLVTITRPSELVWILVPLFWGVWNWKTFKEKLNLLKRNFAQVLVLLFCLAAVGSLQLFYWKYTSGQWFSYNHTEGFDFTRPFTMRVLFSYKKGWLLYTPLMIFSILGFFMLYKKQKPLFFPFLIFFLMNLWVISSWECWWYGGSFGQRPFVQSYGLMAIPLGYFLQSAFSKIIFKYISFSLVLFCLLLNQFQIWQLNNGILDDSRNTEAYYWKVFGKTKIDNKCLSLLEIDRGNLLPLSSVGSQYTPHQILFFDYESPKQIRSDELLCDTMGNQSKHSEILDKDHSYGMVFKCPFDSLTKKDHLRIKLEADIYIEKKNGPLNLAFTCAMVGHRLQTYGYDAYSVSPTDPDSTGWTHVVGFFTTPEILHSDDQFITTILNSGENIFIDNVRLTVFEPK